MRSLVIPLLLALTPSLALGQSVDHYAKLRKANEIARTTPLSHLDTLTNGRIVEIAGSVNGSFRVADRAALMVERADGTVQVVECAAIPGWLQSNASRVRMLVKIHRPDITIEPVVELLAAIPEADASGLITTSKAPAKATAAAKPKREWTLPASEVTPIYASFIRSRNRRLTPSQAMEIAQGIVGFSLHYGVDARLIMAMVMVESGFNPSATSRAGAMGLGQLMPGTAAGLGVSNPYDSMENLFGAVKLLRGHLDKYKSQNHQDYGSLVLALAAYNAGGGAVKKYGGVPPYRETQNYVRKVISLYNALSGRS